MTDMRAIREGLKLNQQQFAERLGIHQTTVSRFEKGDITPTLETALKAFDRSGIKIGPLTGATDADIAALRRLAA